MSAPHLGPLELQVAIEKFPLKQPFNITGSSMVDADLVVVTLHKDGKAGRGEASGVYYRAGDDPEGVVRQIEAARAQIEAGIDRDSLQQMLPTGGARNALDCALWDLEAKLTGRPVWHIAGLPPPRPLLTTFAVGANAPRKMALDALAYKQAKAIKIKLTGTDEDADRVRAVREARPEVWLGVDANQGYTPALLDQLMPVLLDAQVQLIEQPFVALHEPKMEDWFSPISLAADESLQGLADLHSLAGRYHVVNIKLDKCGGLSEALAIARASKQLGLEVMVGNMVGTSLSMAPAFLVGQLCDIVDLDGPVFLRFDRNNPVRYEDGTVSCPDSLWGGV